MLRKDSDDVIAVELSTSKQPQDEERLESKKYSFKVEGSMPVLDFNITPGGAVSTQGESERIAQHLTLELYNPASGALFEAKFPKGRIEVDADGTMTYFSMNVETLNLSLFLGRNITISMNKKTGEVIVKSPSKITSVEEDIQSKIKGKRKSSQVTTDTIKIRLE